MNLTRWIRNGVAVIVHATLDTIDRDLHDPGRRLSRISVSALLEPFLPEVDVYTGWKLLASRVDAQTRTK